MEQKQILGIYFDLLRHKFSLFTSLSDLLCVHLLHAAIALNTKCYGAFKIQNEAVLSHGVLLLCSRTQRWPRPVETWRCFS